MNRPITTALLSLFLSVAGLSGPTLAQESPSQGISTNADGSHVTSTAGVNPTANGGGGTIIYGDISTGPGYTVITPATVETAPLPAPVPAEPAPAPASVAEPAAEAPGPVDTAVATSTDLDADNMPDDQEWDLGLDPNNADSDGDGVADGDELNIYGTDPVAWDTDGDGVADGEELFGSQTDPLAWDDFSTSAGQAVDSADQQTAGAQSYQEAAAPPATQTLAQGTTENLTAADGNAAARGAGDASAAPGTVTRDGVTTSPLGPDGTYNVTESAPANVSISGDTEVLSPPLAAPVETSGPACSDYATWYDAQVAYEAAGMTAADPAMVASLDPDYDGIACEEGM